MSSLTEAGPHEPGAYGSTGGGFSSSGAEISHRRSMPSDAGEQGLVAEHGVQDQPLVALERVGGAKESEYLKIMLASLSVISAPGSLARNWS